MGVQKLTEAAWEVRRQENNKHLETVLASATTSFSHFCCISIASVEKMSLVAGVETAN
jgi:hypothetical protein